MTIQRDYQEKAEEVEALVAPWLPDAKVTIFDIQESCCCYSEYTQEPPHLEVTFSAPRPDDDSDKALGKIINVVEKMVMAWAKSTFSFRGCECCEGTDNLSMWVRVIRSRSSVGLASRQEGR